MLDRKGVRPERSWGKTLVTCFKANKNLSIRSRYGGTCHGAHLLHRVMPCAPCADSAQDPQLDPRSPSQLAACIHTGDSFLSLTCARASAMSARTKRLLYL